MCSCALVGHNHLGPFLRAAALRQHDRATSSASGSRQDPRGTTNLAADWAWPEDVANPLSHLTLLTSVDLTANGLSHVGCDVMASLRSLSELVVADNLIARLDDVSLECAGPRLARLDVSNNRLARLAAHSLTVLSGLEQLDARFNPLLCDGDAACVARRDFRRWLNDSARRLVLVRRRPDDVPDEYACPCPGTRTRPARRTSAGVWTATTDRRPRPLDTSAAPAATPASYWSASRR